MAATFPSWNSALAQVRMRGQDPTPLTIPSPTDIECLGLANARSVQTLRRAMRTAQVLARRGGQGARSARFRHYARASHSVQGDLDTFPARCSRLTRKCGICARATARDTAP